ncbi:hypothetical protein BB559_002347, partial [Furculomyces boomerangus]
YTRQMPPSRSKTSQNVVKLIKFYLAEYSVPSSISRRTPANDTLKISIRNLLRTQKFIYFRLVPEHPDVRLGLSTFYSLSQAEKALNAFKSGQNTDPQVYFNAILNGMDNESCIIISDFKQNFKIGGGPVEENRVYYNKIQISDLCFCLITKSGEITQRYYNYMSRFLANDSKYTIDYLIKFLGTDDFSNYTNLYLWSDAGTHFRSNEYIYGVFETIRNRYSSKNFFLNYFMECHGKSDVDGGGPVEENRVYYNKIQISDLCFCLITKSGEITQRYYNYMSRFLANDSKYTIDYLIKFLGTDNFSNYTNVYLWSDAGTNFRSNEYIYGVFETIRNRYSSKNFFLNYFMECHGKSDEYLKSKLKDERYYFREYKGQGRSAPINTMVVENLKNYLSFYYCLNINKLKVCYLSTMNSGNNIIPKVSKVAVPVSRKYKTAPVKTNNPPEYSIMDKNSRSVHKSRIGFLGNL